MVITFHSCKLFTNDDFKVEDIFLYWTRYIGRWHSMNYFYTSLERNDMLHSLTETQRNFLLGKLKRGKHTVLSNELVKGKGTLSGSDQELENEIQQWEFIDLLDGGEGNRPFRCECGMPLRYQYIVQNMETGEIRRFGKQHFEYHTGIPSTIVKDIIKGFEQLDYEMDEILYKLDNNWDSSILTKISNLKIDIPLDIQEQHNLELSLLEKQLNRLQKLVRDKERELQQQELRRIKEVRIENFQTAKTAAKSGAESVPLIPRSESKTINFTPVIHSPLGNDIHQFIIQLLEKYGTISVLEICQELNSIPHNFKGSYSTGKPKVYLYASMVMEQLAKQGACKVEKAGLDNRWYSVLSR
jgi:hypothetical protein